MLQKYKHNNIIAFCVCVIAAMNWDHIQTLYILFRLGTLAQAARELSIDPTTVSRRLTSLEKELGARLFTREEGRYIPTDIGHSLYEKAKAMAELAQSLDHLSNVHDDQISGNVRITAVESLVMDCLVPKLPPLRERFPNLNIQFVSTDLNLSLNKRETDIAIRFAKPNLLNIVTKKLADTGFSVYVASHLDNDWTQFSNKKTDWVTYEDEYAKLPEAQWMQKKMQKKEPALKSNDAGVLKMAIKVGLGVGALPCYRGDPDPSLIRISGPTPIVNREAWLLAPANYHSNPAIRTIVGWVQELFEQEQSLLRGIIT